MGKPKLFLIDGSNIFFRAYHAIQRLTNSRGLPTNAVYGYTAMLLKVLEEQRPDYIAVAWDLPGPTFREALYPKYKANRKETPEDLVQQIPLIRRVTEALSIQGVGLEGYEADDVIGTLTRKAEQAGMAVVIVTGDKDFMQLVTENVTLLDTMKERVIDVAAVRERFGTTPDRVIDVLGLCGDAVDNVRGVIGVGEKTAVKLVAEHGSMDDVLAAAKKMKKGKLRENLIHQAGQARLARQLVTIACDAPVPVALEALARRPPDVETLVPLFRELEFNRFLEMFEAQRAPVKEEERAAVGGDYRAAATLADVETAVREARSAGRFAFDTETDGLDPVRARLIGLSLAPRPGSAWYIPIAHAYADAPPALPEEAVRAALATLFEDPGVAKFAFHAKFDLHVLAGWGVRVRGLAGDPMIASALLNPVRKAHGLKDLAAEHFGLRMETFEEVMRKAAPPPPAAGAVQRDLFGGDAPAAGSAGSPTFARVPVEAARSYCSADSDMTLRLEDLLLPRLAGAGLESLYREIEVPLVGVLLEMERTGILLDRARLAGLSRDLEAQLAALTRDIHGLAGGEFNIDSPKQLQVVLFDTLKLPPGRKTKTGYSTDVEELERLAREHEMPRKLVEYRGLAKLKSGYVDSLPGLVNPATGRIHTSYSQTGAVTGRLASSDPNLQNIPIRTAEGRRIRACFVAAPGCVLLSADYSQIELRILAHLSRDPVLCAAFQAGRDIHTETAARVFGVAPEAVTSEQRRQAKAINFGIIYGMGPHGLATSLEIPHAEAERIIDQYYQRYPAIRDYLEGLVEEARRTGRVKTMLGRLRPIPDLDSKNPALRGIGERTAKNTPIQGSAADLIKLAMIRAQAGLEQARMRTRMLLTVHDELVFEAPAEEVAAALPVVRAAMEQAMECSVPIVVEMKSGPNWAEMTPLPAAAGA